MYVFSKFAEGSTSRSVIMHTATGPVSTAPHAPRPAAAWAESLGDEFEACQASSAEPPGIWKTASAHEQGKRRVIWKESSWHPGWGGPLTTPPSGEALTAPCALHKGPEPRARENVDACVPACLLNS